MNGTPPKLTFEITKSSEITKLISDGIRAAEALEDSILRQKHQQQQKKASADLGSNTLPAVNSNSKLASSGSASAPSYNNALGPPHQQPAISTAQPETLHGETNLHALLNSLHPQSQSSSLAPPPTSSPPSSSSSSISKRPLAPALLASPSHIQHTPHLHMPHYIAAAAVATHNVSGNLPLTGPQKTIGLSEFLRPPFNAPLFHPVKLPGQRPFPGPLKKVHSSKPILPQHLPRHPPGGGGLGNGPLPQPSVIVNHYRKPMPSILRPFFKDTHLPLQPLAASVLLLGQPTELNNHRKTESHLHSHSKKPIIPVPYADLTPQSSLQKQVLNQIHGEKLKTPNQQHIIPPHVLATEKVNPYEKPLSTLATVTPTSGPSVGGGVFKNPFDVHEIENEPSPADIAAMKPAINEGFKPDTVVVENGFKPILRLDGPMPPPEVVEQMANRREDPGLEIDEAMESDTLFLTAHVQQTQTQNFEPMFIPSPPDSTNASIIIRKSSGVQSHSAHNSGISAAAKDPMYSQPISSMLKSASMPEAAELRNATLQDILNEASDEQEVEEPEREPIDNKIEDKPKPTHHKLMATPVLEENMEMEEKISPEYLKGIKQSQQSEELEEEDIEQHNEEQQQAHFLKYSEKEDILKVIPQDTTKSDMKSSSPSITTSTLKPLPNKLKKYDNQQLDDIEMDDGEDMEEEISDLFDMEQEEHYSSEPEAQAAERIETYYLPPDNRQIPSASDAASGSGTVIAYDGKSVMDSSLVLPPKLDSEIEDEDQNRSSARFFGRNTQSISKLEQLIRSTPQFVPFRGEIPPLNPDSVPAVSVQPITSASGSRPSSTKLQIIHNKS
ncbi:protein Skeletor, isoforms D/E-like [Stomoxys calcitrans]|uniref:protein Skeletor, isoforms D/E-like n=1 Tax=Stomoxys calcitrans TaxID=35570 RepID=UPI0027E36D4A|nr:protein Skeletor, isoforms D/E-like [Stomoxys calcitrans]